MKIHSVVTILSLTLVSSIFAQSTSDGSATSRIDAREARQEQRIEHGMASGTLTSQETARLNAGQARVDNAQTRASADGTVNTRERAQLSKMQNKQNRHIARQKHDRQRS